MPVEPVHVAGAVLDIAVPARSNRMAGISMAGFRGRASDRAELPVVPYPALTIFLDLGDASFIDASGGVRRRGSAVIGLHPVGMRGSGRVIDLLQVRLSPVVAHEILGVPGDLGDSVVPLADLWGGDAARIQERMHATASWDERFALAKSVLTRRAAAGRAVDPEVAFAWQRIALSQGRIRVERLAAETGWSRKRLWSRFRSQVGLTPKRAAQLIRFDHAAHRLAGGHSPATVAAEGGYTDQSHLYREVMSFAGLTPTAIAHAPWLEVDPVAWSAPEYAPRP
ncbi:helix-turn-helix domain-containing protein [Nocardia sp. N2S4-5]|uniref:helix-turn-helix domain-containing protein n=1 Tax=Nocardia sp. N2S4-5 TaxID=3351565 RepID=UPI0037D8133D